MEHKPSGKPVNIDGKVVLVFNYSTDDELRIINAFVTQAKKHININAVIAFNSTSNKSAVGSDDFIFLANKNDFNLFGRVNKRLNKWFINTNFDLMISFISEGDLYCNKIVSRITSGFKLGIYNHENVKLFDITIKQETNNYNKQLELFIYYVNKLKINV